MSLLDEQKVYLQRLTRHLKSVLGGEPKGFNQVVEAAAGAYPTDVLSVLQSLVASGEVNECEGVYSDAKLAVEMHYEGNEDTADAGLPNPKEGAGGEFQTRHYSDPHPADYDWRYSSSALAELFARLAPLLERGERVALLGAVTLFPVLAAHSKDVVLFDRSTSALTDLRAMGFEKGLIRHDLFDPIPGLSERYAAVVGDPPWYPDFHRAFVLRASELLREDGLLLLSVLPWLTRPSAVIDRFDILQFAARAGFDLAELEPGILRYQSPKFERAALSSKGIHCGEWRTGDLYVFRRVGEAEPGLFVTRPPDEPEWDEYRLGARKVKLRRRTESKSGFAVWPASDNGAVLEEVSRRSGVRTRIDLWTSDNRAYAIRGRGILHQALRSLEAGGFPTAIVAGLPADLLSREEASTLVQLLRELLAANAA